MPEFVDLPMPYDQLQRYTVLQKFLATFYPGKRTRVLDVGGLSPDRDGQAFFLPLKLIHSGPGIVLDPLYSSLAEFVQGNGTQLPFPENSFEVVAALDVIEHIPAPEREAFLKELSRVSKGSVFVCAPYRDANIEGVEELLYCQIKKRYGIEHQQLMEHKKHGLPEVQHIASILSQHAGSGTSFAYGSLTNWMMAQSLKNAFMFKRTTASVHYFLDKWLSGGPQDREFTPPFCRNYWIYSSDIRPNKLKKGIKAMQAALKELVPAVLAPSEFPAFHQALVDYHCSDRLAALVVAEGHSRYIKECLNHLLTQKIQLDMDVSLWDLRSDTELKEYLETELPGVKYYAPAKDDPLPNALLKVINRLPGEYILLLSGDILLPANTVSLLHSELSNHPGIDVLSPRIDWNKEEAVLWGKEETEAVAEDFNSEKAAWLQSECLFFRKEAIFARKWKSPTPSKEHIFLWEKAKVSGRLHYFPQHTVYKK